MCFGSTLLRARILLLFSAFLGLSNLLMIINYQYAKRSVKEDANHIDEKDQALYGDLRRLQIEINETFRRFDEIERVAGKAFEQAALFKGNWTQRRKDDQLKKGNHAPVLDCKQAPFLLILIHSKPANVKERAAIRMSWGRHENNINKVSTGTQHVPRLWKTVFLLGQTHNPTLDDLLLDEASFYEDIVFGDFIDSYRNLTRKMALGVQWAAKHCQAEYVMKADEDSYVNIHELILWLKEYQRKQRGKPLYVGAALIDKEPYREPDNKFYVSKKEYPYATYPPYASGSGYLFSGKLLVKLSEALRVVRLFPNEDACFGSLMQYIKVKLMNDERFDPFSMQIASYSEYEGHSLCQFNGPLVIHRVSGKLQIQTHFNVLILKHVPTICEHINTGIGDSDHIQGLASWFSVSVLDDTSSDDKETEKK